VPWLWKVGMLILVVCLIASMGIAIFRLATTPTEILGDGFRDLSPKAAKEARDELVSSPTGG
jgi:hypothetical protein